VLIGDRSLAADVGVRDREALLSADDAAVTVFPVDSLRTGWDGPAA
jgi:hypothetical protein